MGFAEVITAMQEIDWNKPVLFERRGAEWVVRQNLPD